MVETDYQKAYQKFRAFIECTRQATRRVTQHNHITPIATPRPCYTKEGSNLLLCDACTAFWHECRHNGDHITWEMAVFHRETHAATSPLGGPTR
jgi:hypothetical protein